MGGRQRRCAPWGTNGIRCALYGRLLPRAAGRSPCSSGGGRPSPPFCCAPLQARATRPTHCAGRFTGFGSLRFTRPGCPSLPAAGRRDFVPYFVIGSLGAPCRSTTGCTLSAADSQPPLGQAQVSRWGDRALDGCGWTPGPVLSTAPWARFTSPCRPRCAVLLPSLRVVARVATLADAVHCLIAKPDGRRFTRSPAGCGFQAGAASMSRVGVNRRGDELRKDGGNAKANTASGAHRDTGL